MKRKAITQAWACRTDGHRTDTHRCPTRIRRLRTATGRHRRGRWRHAAICARIPRRRRLRSATSASTHPARTTGSSRSTRRLTRTGARPTRTASRPEHLYGPQPDRGAAGRHLSGAADQQQRRRQSMPCWLTPGQPTRSTSSSLRAFPPPPIKRRRATMDGDTCTSSRSGRTRSRSRLTAPQRTPRRRTVGRRATRHLHG